MAVTGTTDFNLDFTELAEEAWERAGREMRSGYDLRTARRSMNLMTIEWQNRGINMWTIDEGYINLVQGQSEYDLPADTIDLLEQVIRTGQGNVSTQADLTITRISVSTYATLPNKLQQARPIQLWYQRLDGQISPTDSLVVSADTAADTITLDSVVGLPAIGYVDIVHGGVTETVFYNYIEGNVLSNVFRAQNGTTQLNLSAGDVVRVNNTPRVTLWPTPDGAQSYQLVYWRMRRIQDAGGGTSVFDVPFRFVPCLVAGLAYYLAMKVPGGMDRLQVLKQQYDEAWMTAADEDQEKAAIRLVPRQMFIGGGT